MNNISEEIATASDLDLAFLKRVTDAIHGAALDLKAANDEADAAEMNRYHAETMRLITKYGMEAVIKIIVQCRNQAQREGIL